MVISIDYDNTYTACPSLFNKIIDLFQKDGHTVICVTNRKNLSTMADEVNNSIGKLVDVIFAGSEWKRDAALKAGYAVDIWIDDSPGFIEKLNLL